MTKSSTGLEPNVAGVLCYVFGWLSGLIFLLLEKDSEFVKFHARQSLALFGVLPVIAMVAPFIPFLGGLIATLTSVVTFVAWIAMIVFAAQGKQVSVPVISELADQLR